MRSGRGLGQSSAVAQQVALAYVAVVERVLDSFAERVLDRSAVVELPTAIEIREAVHSAHGELFDLAAGLVRTGTDEMITTGSDGIKDVRPPLSDADIELLKAGDRVRITGVLYTARDAAHGRLFPLIEKGETLLSQFIKKVEIVAYEDLGTEAIRRLEVENFPAVVINDCHGGDLYEEGMTRYAR